MMEQRKVEPVETEVAMAAAVKDINQRWTKDVFVMNGGVKIPFTSVEFGLTPFGETVDSEIIQKLCQEILESVFVPIMQQREEEAFKSMAS